jgi:EAL domain-containing protein (putative c-di-GMP-specific phosphodiesterase class I)/CHASE2 domain-containing sensor protein
MAGMKSASSLLRTLPVWLREIGWTRLAIIVCAALVGIAIGVSQVGIPIENAMRSVRNDFRSHDASGEIVIVAIDDRSLSELQKWPWPRSYHGKLIDNLRRSGARRIFLDVEFSSESAPAEDAALAAAIARPGAKVTLANLIAVDPVSEEQTSTFPIKAFRDVGGQANINLIYENDGSVWEVPYGMLMDGRYYPSFATSLASRSSRSEDFFLIDHAIRPDSIPVVSAADVMASRAPRSSIVGKDVVIGAASMQLGDMYNAPGHGLISGVYLHVLAAETLKKGTPLRLPWQPVLSSTLLLLMFALSSRRVGVRLAGCAVLIFAISAAALGLESLLVSPDTLPALAAAAVALALQAAIAAKTAIVSRTGRNEISGLPNVNAFRKYDMCDRQFLIVAKVHNYLKIVSSLPANCEKDLAQQISARMRIGNPETRIFQADDGVFMCYLANDEGVQDHVSALHGLFREPVVVGPNRYDLLVTIGLDSGFADPPSRRSTHALLAAELAFAKGEKWQLSNPAAAEDSAWHLSLLGQLDEAIENGQIWVAYQPQLDLKTGLITGAEALVRWAHPERGNVSPVEFIQAAERSGRIDRLTAFVMDEAFRAVADLRRRGLAIDMSVNLSGRLLGDDSVAPLVQGLLAKHQVPAERIILEVTETAALDDASIARLKKIRELGVRISLDDYGTGFSTLEYFRQIPASEIKIDRSFIRTLSSSLSDRLMVSSTIQLAHALDRRVVAEGVEDSATYHALSAMECDIAQGFYIARPMPLWQLYRTLRQRASSQQNPPILTASSVGSKAVVGGAR